MLVNIGVVRSCVFGAVIVCVTLSTSDKRRSARVAGNRVAEGVEAVPLLKTLAL
jgi:hypothetical protein